KLNSPPAALIGVRAKTRGMRGDPAAPQCLPADAIGGGKDVYRHKSGTVLYQNNGKADFLQTGEMILVGKAWKLIDAPVPGHAPIEEKGPMGSGGRDDVVQIPEAVRPLLEKLREVDAWVKGSSGLAEAYSVVR